MSYWPSALRNYEFNPIEVELLTRVSHDLQRQWRVRYLDFRQISFVHRALGRGRWTWEGVQLLALFARALGDIRDGQTARQVLMLDDKPGMIRDPLGIYQTDQRRIDGDSLLIAGDLGGSAGFSTTTASNLASMLENSLEPARLYIVDFSRFQRDLFDKATGCINLENGPGAVPIELRV